MEGKKKKKKKAVWSVEGGLKGFSFFILFTKVPMVM
jgi:hypothetical protein